MKSKKKPLFGNNKPFSLKRTRRKQNPNFQKITLEDGRTKKLTAREIKTLKKAS